MPIIEAQGLHKTYRSKDREVRALDGFDLAAERGTVTGLLGPNGAGKTTAVKVLTTLIRPDRGRPGRRHRRGADPQAVRRVIGSSGQFAAVDENLTGLENLEMVGRLYHLGIRAARARAAELIELFDLTEAGDRPVKGFSGGMRRRIDLAGALVIHPRSSSSTSPPPGSTRAAGSRCGGHQGAGGRRHDGAADHPVPRGGRPAGQLDLRHRLRAGHRPGHLR